MPKESNCVRFPNGIQGFSGEVDNAQKSCRYSGKRGDPAQEGGVGKAITSQNLVILCFNAENGDIYDK